MADQFGTPVSAYGEPPKKSNNTMIIIVVVVVLLCCCCVVLAGATYWLWMNGDALIQQNTGMQQMLPLLM